MSNLRHPPPGDDEPAVRTLGARYPDGFVLEAHAHSWAQLLYASSGVMVVEARRTGVWVVPPHRAVWLPAETTHRVAMRGEVAMKTAYFRDASRLPSRTCVVSVSPLLRELLAFASAKGKLRTSDPHEARVAGLLVDLVAEVETMPLALPMPRDARAVRVAEALRADPGAKLRVSGASARTIERLFVAETGMTLGTWRRQARLLAALAQLAEGAPVTRVALDVGYATPSAFIAMFRSALGTTPSRFFA